MLYFSHIFNPLISTLVVAINLILPSAKADTLERYSAELPQLLERDALTVLSIGIANESASKICARTPPPFNLMVPQKNEEWKTKNRRYISAAGSAIGEFSAKIDKTLGPIAKEAYLTQVTRITGSSAQAMTERKFASATVANDVAPSVEKCFEHASYLSSGQGDFDSTPQYVKELTKYADRVGIKQ
jgi:hypothetical protein